MARKLKQAQFTHCKVVITSHPKAPWRVIRDVARVADECGNSPNVIKRHYREIVTTEAAKVFFAIRPEKRRKSKITNIESGRASA